MKTETDKVLQTILTRFENRLSVVETKLKLTTTQAATSVSSLNKLSHQFAENVSSLVGLKEAVTWHRPSIKYIWAALLCLGIVATTYYIYNTLTEYLDNPTATNVQFLRQPKYPYPPLVLCPHGVWLDTEKALSMGLTIDALKYSIAYANYFAFDENLKIENAKKKFLDFFKEHNFTSLYDYYKAITNDLRQATSFSDLANINEPSFICDHCHETKPYEPVFINDQMCFAFLLKSVNSKYYHTFSTAPSVVMKIKDKTRGVVRVSPNWRAYVMPNQHLIRPTFPAIYLEPFTRSILKVSAQRFITISNNEFPCLSPDRIGENYSTDRCIVNCLHRLFKDTIKCHVFLFRSTTR